MNKKIKRVTTEGYRTSPLGGTCSCTISYCVEITMEDRADLTPEAEDASERIEHSKDALRATLESTVVDWLAQNCSVNMGGWVQYYPRGTRPTRRVRSRK